MIAQTDLDDDDDAGDDEYDMIYGLTICYLQKKIIIFVCWETLMSAAAFHSHTG